MCDPILRIPSGVLDDKYAIVQHTRSWHIICPPPVTQRGSQSAQMHACSGCAVASDSGWPAAAGPAKMAIWAIIFHQPPLDVAWGGTCTIPIEHCLDPVSRYIAGIHLHRRIIRLIYIKGTAQSILSPAPSKKIRYAEIDAFHRHHGPMARAACGRRSAVVRPYCDPVNSRFIFILSTEYLKIIL